jgi:hypothetical protein
MVKAVANTPQQITVGDDARPSVDTVEIAATLRYAADVTRDAATQFKLLGEVLQLLVKEAEPQLGTSSGALLAAKVGIWNARQSTCEFEAVYETLSMEADRYAR